MPLRFSQTTRALAADSSRRTLGLWALSGSTLVAWAVWMLFGHVIVYETSGRARLEVQQAPHHVSSMLPSKVLTAHIVLGQTVKKDEVLVELDAASEKLRLQEEEAKLVVLPKRIAALNREADARRVERDEDVEASKASVAVSQNKLREAEFTAEFARENERRIARLLSMGSATAVESQRTATEAQKAAAVRDGLTAEIRRIERDAAMRVAQRNAQIEAVENTIVQLNGEVEVTQASIQRLREDIEKLRIRAPIAGRIGDVIPLHVGAYIAQGQKVATIVPPGGLIAVADFSPSTSLGRIRAGQKAKLRLESYPWSQYGVVELTLTRVASEIRDGFIRAEFAIDHVPSSGIAIQHGLPGSIEVAVENITPATLVVRAAGFVLPAAARAAP